MNAIVFIVPAIVLISLTIWALHKNHIKKTLELAENDNRLVPLHKPQHTVKSSSTISVLPEINQAHHKNGNPQTWSEEIKSLRDAGDLRAALALSKRQYPRILAFRQTLITLRAGLKQESDYSKEYLNDLYSTAILGDLVKVKSATSHDLNLLKIQLQKLGEPKEYWKTLGYKNLRLLTKTDCRLLTKHWGEPLEHRTIDQIINS